MTSIMKGKFVIDELITEDDRLYQSMMREFVESQVFSCEEKI